MLFKAFEADTATGLAKRIGEWVRISRDTDSYDDEITVKNVTAYCNSNGWHCAIVQYHRNG